MDIELNLKLAGVIGPLYVVIFQLLKMPWGRDKRLIPREATIVIMVGLGMALGYLIGLLVSPDDPASHNVLTGLFVAGGLSGLWSGIETTAKAGTIADVMADTDDAHERIDALSNQIARVSEKLSQTVDAKPSSPPAPRANSVADAGDEIARALTPSTDAPASPESSVIADRSQPQEAREDQLIASGLFNRRTLSSLVDAAPTQQAADAAETGETTMGVRPAGV